MSVFQVLEQYMDFLRRRLTNSLFSFIDSIPESSDHFPGNIFSYGSGAAVSADAQSVRLDEFLEKYEEFSL